MHVDLLKLTLDRAIAFFINCKRRLDFVAYLLGQRERLALEDECRVLHGLANGLGQAANILQQVRVQARKAMTVRERLRYPLQAVHNSRADVGLLSPRLRL